MKILDSESSYNKKLIWSEMVHKKTKTKLKQTKWHRDFAWILSIYYSISLSFLIPSCLYYSFHEFIYISILSYFLSHHFPNILFLPFLECHFCDSIWNIGKNKIFLFLFTLSLSLMHYLYPKLFFISIFDLRYVILKISCIFILIVTILL